MTSINIYLRQVRTAIITIVLVGLPFHAFLITWAQSITGPGKTLTLLSAWKEILILLFIITCAGEIIIKKKFQRLDILDWLIIAYSGLAVLWGLIQKEEIGQWLAGVRLDVVPLLLFALVRRLEWNFERLKKWIFGVAGIVIIFGLVQALLLPQDFLARFGYTLSRAGFENAGALASCQYLEHTQVLCRAVSTFGGPTRFGTYLLVVIGLFWMSASQRDKKSEILISLATLAGILTYSRSVWLGLIAMLTIAAYRQLPRKGKLIAAGVVTAIAITVFLSFQLKNANLHDPLRSILLRSNSTQGHITYMKNGIKSLIEKPLGQGLGTAGAASMRYKKFLTENWWLQLGVEMGWIGMILFTGIIFNIGLLLYKTTNSRARGLLLALIGISVTGFLTHSFEELASSITLFVCCGIALQKN